MIRELERRTILLSAPTCRVEVLDKAEVSRFTRNISHGIILTQGMPFKRHLQVVLPEMPKVPGLGFKPREADLRVDRDGVLR